MISNDERHKAAISLRNVSGAPEWATTACCIAECLGEYDYTLWDDSKPLFNRLADLIYPEPERTCEIVKDVFDWKCSVCGNVITEQVNYCPNCGAKVVDE